MEKNRVTQVTSKGLGVNCVYMNKNKDIRISRLQSLEHNLGIVSWLGLQSLNQVFLFLLQLDGPLHLW